MDANWDDLRVFLTLAREGTLTTAAKALGVSHPTVSRRVQALEQQIGARLDLEPEFQLLFFYTIGKSAYPSRFQSKDVVAEPDMIVLEFFF